MAKESLGVAYSMKRRNKKYAKGGMVGEKMMDTSPDSEPAELMESDMNRSEMQKADQPMDDLHSNSTIHEDIVQAILAKRKFATGGMVEDAGQVDDKFMPIDQFSEHGDPNDVDSPGPDMDHESDDQDLVAQILKGRKKRA